MCHTHDDTPSLRPNAYKLKVEGISPRYRIEQICEGFHPKQTIPYKGEVRPSTTRMRKCAHTYINFNILILE